MDLIFNELSLYHKPKDERQGIEILNNFADVCKKAKQYKLSKLRAENIFWNEFFIQEISILTFLNKLNRTSKSFLISYVRRPYLTEGEGIENDSFIVNDYFLHSKAKNAEDLLEIKVTGLAYAYLYDTIAVSLYTSDIWNKGTIKIIEKDKDSENVVDIKHVCKLEHFYNHTEWIENQQPIVLVYTRIKPENKKIKLASTHHGNNKLLEKAKHLVQSPYVKRVLNSIDYSPTEKNFIKQCFPNGEIDIVLTKTEAGYGMKILTTGRNLKETELIAQKLWDKYYK